MISIVFFLLLAFFGLTIFLILWDCREGGEA